MTTAIGRPACPDPETLDRWSLGQIDTGDGAAIASLVEGCSRCEAQLQRNERLLAAIGSPLRPAERAAFATQRGLNNLMRRLDESVERTEAQPRRSWMAWAVSCSALAACLGIWAMGLSEGGFRARGIELSDRLASEVGTRLFRTTGEDLREGSAIATGDAIAASYRNIGERVRFLLLFAVDSQGEVHWIAPGHLQDQADEPSVPLKPGEGDQVLPEAVRLEDVPPGRLIVVSLVSEEPLSVQKIEQLAASDRDPTVLRRRFPTARMTATDLVALPAAASASPTALPAVRER